MKPKRNSKYFQMEPERKRIEYKQKLTDNLEKEVIAFLNYEEDGLIYWGINKLSKASVAAI